MLINELSERREKKELPEATLKAPLKTARHTKVFTLKMLRREFLA
tara:strand:- start:111 stop:245 length:135 start_codon:yes stop_codon:yes gene_type:complete